MREEGFLPRYECSISQYHPSSLQSMQTPRQTYRDQQKYLKYLQKSILMAFQEWRDKVTGKQMTQVKLKQTEMVLGEGTSSYT